MSTKSVEHSDPIAQTGFTVIPNAVLLNPDLSISARLVYGILKSYAWKDEKAWPGQDRLAEELGVTAKTLRGFMHELVDAKLVTVERRGRGLTNLYRVHEPVSEGSESTVQERTVSTVLDRKPTTVLDGKLATDPIEQEYEVEEDEVTPSGIVSSYRPMKVNGKVASEEEYAKAQEVLQAFNDVFSTRFTTQAWLGKLVMRLREHPALSVEEHRAVIARSHAAPWWDDAPSPAVVYGNAACFEKALMAVGTPVNGNGNGHSRGLTVEQILAKADELERQGR